MNGNSKIANKHKFCVEGVVLTRRAVQSEIDFDMLAKKKTAINDINDRKYIPVFCQ